MTTTAATQDRPLITRSRAELERAVLEAARAMVAAQGSGFDDWWWLKCAVTDLDEWEKLRAEAAVNV